MNILGLISQLIGIKTLRLTSIFQVLYKIWKASLDTYFGLRLIYVISLGCSVTIYADMGLADSIQKLSRKLSHQPLGRHFSPWLNFGFDSLPSQSLANVLTNLSATRGIATKTPLTHPNVITTCIRKTGQIPKDNNLLISFIILLSSTTKSYNII